LAIPIRVPPSSGRGSRRRVVRCCRVASPVLRYMRIDAAPREARRFCSVITEARTTPSMDLQPVAPAMAEQTMSSLCSDATARRTSCPTRQRLEIPHSASIYRQACGASWRRSRIVNCAPSAMCFDGPRCWKSSATGGLSAGDRQPPHAVKRVAAGEARQGVRRIVYGPPERECGREPRLQRSALTAGARGCGATGGARAGASAARECFAASIKTTRTPESTR